MTAEDSLDYQKIKVALLCLSRFSDQAYNEKFRNAKAEDGESGTQFISCLSVYFDRWIETAVVPKTFEGLRDKMIAEEFLKCCYSKLVFIKEPDVETTSEMGDICDPYLEGQCMKYLSRATEDRKK